jgi:hypothetical protein
MPHYAGRAAPIRPAVACEYWSIAFAGEAFRLKDVTGALRFSVAANKTLTSLSLHGACWHGIQTWGRCSPARERCQVWFPLLSLACV